MTKMLPNKKNQEEDYEMSYENDEYYEENEKEKKPVNIFKNIDIKEIIKKPITIIIIVLIIIIIILLTVKNCQNKNVSTNGGNNSNIPIVILNQSSLSMLIGENYNLDAEVSTKTGSSIAWTSENNDIVAIDNDGHIIANKEGTVEVSAVYIYNNKAYSSSCSVTVNKERVVAEEISFVDNSISIANGTNYSLEPVFFPTNVNDKNLTWLSSDESIATVNNGVVKALKPGTVTITARTSNNKLASAVITIASNSVSVSEVIASPRQMTLKVGEISKINYLVLPNNALNKTVTFTSNSSNIATVSSSGNVIAITPGSTTITVTTTDGSKKDIVNITVIANNDSSSQGGTTPGGTTPGGTTAGGTTTGGTISGGTTPSGSVTCTSGWVWLETPEDNYVGFVTAADKNRLQPYSKDINIKVTRVSNCISELYYSINNGGYIKTGYGKEISITRDGEYTIKIKGITTSGGTIYATYYAKKSTTSSTPTPTNPCGETWIWLTTPQSNYVGFVKEADQSKLQAYNGDIDIKISNVSSCISKLYYSINGGSYIKISKGDKISIKNNGYYTIQVKGITTTGYEITTTYYAQIEK